MSKSLTLFLLLFATFLSAQSPMRVVHCTAVSQNTAVTNIFINKENDKWVGTNEGLYQIHSADNGSRIAIEDQQWALLREACGNAPLTIDRAELFSDTLTEGKIALQGDNRITAAYFDSPSDELWVGTSEQGVFRFNLQGSTQFIEQINADNSKLRSNHINVIFIDQYGRLWIGTQRGVLFGNNGKWKLYEKNANIQAITAIGPDVWLMGEEILWRADAKNRWIPGDFDLSLSQGQIKDISFDSEGRLWIASEVITRYDIVADKVETFGPGQGFTSKNVVCIQVDSDNALWVGTRDKGVFLIEKKSEMTVSCMVEEPLSCRNQEASASLRVKIIGGKGPFVYRWDKGLEGENPQNLGPGLYSLTVTDSEERKKIVSAKIERPRLALNITQELQASSDDAADGSAIAKVGGGSPKYIFAWDNGETTPRADELKAGQHRLTVTDQNGCKAVGAISIGVRLAPPPEPEPIVEAPETPAPPSTPTPPAPPAEVIAPLKLVLVQTSRNDCPGDRKGALNAKIEGGKGPYRYRWTPERYTGKQIDQLPAGTYTLTILDARDSSQTASVTIKTPEPITATATQILAASRERARDGRAEVQASGGNGGFTYIWDNGETKAAARKLIAGKHSVTVVDAKQCSATAELTIGLRQLPELHASSLSSGQIIRLKNLYFDADSSTIEPISMPVLDEIYSFLRNNKGVMIEVGGHTNNIPEHAYCDRLSKARAKAVADYIVDKGIESSRIAFKGYGKRKPIASNKSAEGRRKNQRVEIKILSVGS
ncbi:MAG: OmpA family protein [Bacteroidota bacterium]